MSCEVAGDTKETAENEDIQDDVQAATTPEKGRVWRWRNQTAGARKNTEGPVLRATVKPVKRFIPEINSTGSVPTSTNSQNHPANGQKNVSSTPVEDHPTPDVKTKRPPTGAPQSSPTSINKKKRVREQWSVEDKNQFFDAVAVHGKDFEAVQKAIAQKHKKRGDESMVKTKDQVRHLYYRTWTTISKLLGHDLSSNSASKGSQELLAVINYGELRKKLGGCIFKKKGILKLNELITYGFTTIRVKGKNYRIKTPSCKALKKINDREDAKKSNVLETRRIKLPLRVNLEMHPLSMCAWNRVHLLAHNPRLRFSVPLDCHLSYLLMYLHKKWKTLGEKMFQLAHGSSLDALPNLNGGSMTDGSRNMIEIHIPPEATVKAKFKVHQIVNTKTHCIVSYVMHKTSKLSSGARKKKKRFEEEMDQSEQLPPVPNELCNSSEDEGAFVEHLSDAEELASSGRDSTTPLDELKEAAKDAIDMSIANVEDISFSGWESTDQDFAPSGSAEDEKVVNSFFQETEIVAECDDDDESFAADLADSNVYFPDHCKVELNVNHDDVLAKPEEEKSNQVESDETRNSVVNVLASSPDLTEPTLPAEVIADQQRPISPPKHDDAPLKSPKQASNFTVPTGENLESDPTPEADTPPCGDDADSPSKSSTPAIQKCWNEENAGDVTLAELYLMLGKPSLFKLCYRWKKRDADDDEDSVRETDQKLPSSLTALVQYAAIMLSKLNKNSQDSNKCAKEQSKKGEGKSENTDASPGVAVGIQCNLLEKSDSSSHQKAASGSCNANKKSSGKGAKKTTASETGDTFAVPKIPTRKTRNHSSMASKSALSNVEGFPQGGQVRLSDVEFRKQIDALNRRRDLFGTQNRNRNRGMRKPFFVQRTMVPNARSVRKMMTLSFDSLGVSKVGFMPVPGQNSNDNDDPRFNESVGAELSSISNSNFNEANTPSDSYADVGGAENSLHMQSRNQTDGAAADLSSVVALAAEEAGLLPSRDAATRIAQEPSNPPNENDSSIKNDTGNIELSSVKQLENIQNGETADDSEATKGISMDECSSSMIKNDVALPIRPPSPSVDSISDILNFATESSSFFNSNLQEKIVEGRQTPLLSMPVLDLPSTPQKPAQSPVHPWSLNCNSRDGLSGFATLDTPQRISSDTEDSLDGMIYVVSKRPRLSGDYEAGDAIPSYSDAETELQMQCLMSENSVDFMAKFQDLIHTSNDDIADSSAGTNDLDNNIEHKETGE